LSKIILDFQDLHWYKIYLESYLFPYNLFPVDWQLKLMNIQLLLLFININIIIIILRLVSIIILLSGPIKYITPISLEYNWYCGRLFWMDAFYLSFFLIKDVIAWCTKIMVVNIVDYFPKRIIGIWQFSVYVTILFIKFDWKVRFNNSNEQIKSNNYNFTQLEPKIMLVKLKMVPLWKQIIFFI